MSQDRTEVPGMSNGPRSPYSRNAAQSTGPVNYQGTYVPGMNSVAPNVESISAAGSGSSKRSMEPCVGFLYSISRQGIGEYWPLHVGRNDIGRSSDCSVCLRERTVSEHHASLNIKQLRTQNRVIASIQDTGSKNGLFVNNEELGYDVFPCKNGDIITVGHNYQLLLIIIDTNAVGLNIAPGFEPVDEEEVQDDMLTPGVPNFDASHTQPRQPASDFNPYDHNQRVNNGTIAMDGAETQSGGGTQFM